MVFIHAYIRLYIFLPSGLVRQLSSSQYEHIVRSKHPDITIPTDVSLSQLILSKAQTFTDRLAMVS